MKFKLISPGELTQQTYYKGCIYGYSGAGKTWAASGAPNPLVLVTETNALATLEHTLNRVYNHSKCDIVHATTMEMVREVEAIRAS